MPKRVDVPAAEVLPEEVLQVVPEIQLESARLGGVPCRACAWIHPTHVTVRTGPKTERTVQGVRPWRGMALMQRAHASEHWLDARVLEYEGAVVDGDTVRHVRADVFFHCLQRTLVGASDDVVVVEFIGAGTLHDG